MKGEVVMTKISVDIENIKNGLHEIGYEISDCIERENNGINWQLKFKNSGSVVTIYDTNKTNNSVVNGRPEEGEKEKLKRIIDDLKCNEFVVDPLNAKIVELIRSRREDYYYDFKQCFNHNKKDSFLHDILCLLNNTENKDAYLIFGVTDDYKVVGVKEDDIKSNNIQDFIKKIKFAGDVTPELIVHKLLFKYKDIVVIECKSSKNVPFYLEKRYKNVRDNCIYTRVGDTNTPKDSCASYKDIEKLWRIHFDC